MATIPRRGPSLSGPLKSGWTAASLVPQATVAAMAPATPMTEPTVTPTAPTNTADLSQYNLTQQELGAVPNLRRSVPQTTPLEQLLSSIFPDAAANFDPTFVDPMADPRQPGATPSLFNTILGNLGAQPSSPAVFTPPTFGTVPAPMGTGNQIAATIPGAPPFLAGAIDRVNASGAFAPQAAGTMSGAGALNLAGIAALAAEQRAQANQMAQEKAAADAAYFQQQQAKQKAQRLAAQRQRQRFGGVNAITSGWASSPVLF